MTEDRLQSSPQLGYRIKSDLARFYHWYYRQRSHEEALFLDVVRYTEIQKLPTKPPHPTIAPLYEILDTLMLFTMLLAPPYDWTLDRLYDISWDNEDIDEIFRAKLGTNSPVGSVKTTEEGIEILTDHFSKLLNWHESDSKEVRTFIDVRYMPRKSNILRYPNIAAILEGLRQYSSIPEFNVVLASLYISVGQEDLAIGMFHNKDSLEAHDHYNLGNIYLKKEDLQTARGYFEHSAGLDCARYNLGITYLKQGDWEAAAKQFEQFLKPVTGNGPNGSIYTFGTDEPVRPDGRVNENGSTYDPWKDPEILPPYDIAIPHSYVIKQFSCNNLGICAYHLARLAGNIREGIVKAKYLFRKAASWQWLTHQEDGVYNAQQMDKQMEQILVEHRKLAVDRKRRSSFHGLIGSSDVMQKVYDSIESALSFDANVLITGDTGTGKELVARAIHEGSRKDKPFAKVNCAGITDDLMGSELFGHKRGAYTGAIDDRTGKFEQAGEGTIFLDEIGKMSPKSQAMLLQVLDRDRQFARVGGNELKELEARVLSATNRNMEDAVKEREFLPDLYNRLNGIHIKLPTLNDRKEDIPELVEHFIAEFLEERTKRDPDSADRRMELTDPAAEVLKKKCFRQS